MVEWEIVKQHLGKEPQVIQRGFTSEQEALKEYKHLVQDDSLCTNLAVRQVE